MAKRRLSDEGVDLLGVVVGAPLTAELRAAKALAAPSLGRESFGMALVRAFACATPVVASDIPGYAAVMSADTGALVPPGDPDALAGALVSLLEDEPRRRLLGASAREEYSWEGLARRLLAIYDGLTLTTEMRGSARERAAPVRAAGQDPVDGQINS
jgi:phosphatidylinositol alpha-mannosyltransferase